MPDAMAEQPLQGHHVLVVEDEFYIADDIANALLALGAKVLGPVPTAGGALEIMNHAERLDLAVLDIDLEGEAVYPVAEALEVRSIPFVFATGYDAASVLPRFQTVPRWEKPFDPHALVRALLM